MKLVWKTSLSATCLHTATCFIEGLPLVGGTLAMEIGGPIEEFLIELQQCAWQPLEALPTLTALSSEIGNNRQLARQAATRLWGSASTSDVRIARIAGALSDLEAALLRQVPQAEEELAVRVRPLREQWESRGPGLMRQIARLSDERLIAPKAEVVLVTPVVGGHGRAHLFCNRVTFEAVLVNPSPELPEILRLAWLLTQLNQDLAEFSEYLSGGHLPQVAALATLPLVLSAAETVELARLDTATLQTALSCWHFSPELPGDVDRKLFDWWQTYTARDTPWAVALKALDALLAE